MSMPSSTPNIGAEVYTTDGSKLGTIKAVQGAYFKVDASMQPDYWLGTECIRGGGIGNRVEVTFAKGDVDRYKQDVKERDM